MGTTQRRAKHSGETTRCKMAEQKQLSAALVGAGGGAAAEDLMGSVTSMGA